MTGESSMHDAATSSGRFWPRQQAQEAAQRMADEEDGPSGCAFALDEVDAAGRAGVRQWPVTG